MKTLETLDYSDSPLPIWKHYGITNFARQNFLEELSRIEYKGSLIGVGVSYTIEAKDETYTVILGKVDGRISRGEFPVGDEFLAEIYGFIEDFVYKNIPEEYKEKIDIRLIAAISGSLFKCIVSCRTVRRGECSNAAHIGTKKKCKSTNGGTSWQCLHQNC